jgi:hypothetical protein
MVITFRPDAAIQFTAYAANNHSMKSLLLNISLAIVFAKD